MDSSTSRQTNLKDMKENVEMVYHRLLVMVMTIGSTKWTTDSPLKLVIADSSGCRRAICISKKHELKLKAGKKILIKRFSLKNGTIYLKECTTIFHGTGKLDISQEITEKSQTLLSAPVSPAKTIEQVLTSPVKTKVSMKGTVVGNEAMKSVMVKGRETNVKEIRVRDRTGEVRVSLWKDSATAEIEVGANIHILDSTVNFNSFFKCNVLNVNYLDDIKIQPTESILVSIEIVGLLDDTITDNNLTVAVQYESGEETELSIPSKILIEALRLDCLTDIEEIMSKLPFTADADIINGKIFQLEIRTG